MSSPQLPPHPHKYGKILDQNWQLVQYPVLSEEDRVLCQENPRSLWVSVVSDVDTFRVDDNKHQHSRIKKVTLNNNILLCVFHLVNLQHVYAHIAEYSVSNSLYIPHKALFLRRSPTLRVSATAVSVCLHKHGLVRQKMAVVLSLESVLVLMISGSTVNYT